MTRLAFPFEIAADGRSAIVGYGDDDNVRQMLELLIFTMPGERVMRPDLGSPVQQMVFGSGNGPVAVALRATLEATIRQWLGHVLELHDLSVTFDDGDGALLIEITYEVLATRMLQHLGPIRKELT